MKRAILSDIHSNLEAFEAVLGHLRGLSIARVYCLGDMLGYGPDPLACLDLAMQLDVCLLGNHDRAALFDPENFSRGAERAICWTRQQLLATDDAASRARWDFLQRLPRNHREDGLLFVHGSPRNPLDEYVFPEDAQNRHKLEKIFGLVQRHSFLGHSHVPGILTASGRFISAHETGQGFPLGQIKCLVNVGSVGQPRDGDRRACYAELDGDRVTFHRVPYPVATTVEKIHAIAQLDDFLGDRLLEGR